jgi:hypothetical protein
MNDERETRPEATAVSDREQGQAAEIEQAERQEEQLSTAQMAAAGSERRPAEPSDEESTAAVGPGPAPADAAEERVPLFTADKAEEHRSRWQAIQIDFVDDPRRAVEQADGLVAQLMKELAEAFAAERAGLERTWERGDDISTEELRITLQRYRSFFDRLLSL